MAGARIATADRIMSCSPKVITRNGHPWRARPADRNLKIVVDAARWSQTTVGATRATVRRARLARSRVHQTRHPTVRSSHAHVGGVVCA
jgi:hypothetical protein